MRRWFAAALCALCLVGLTACGGQEQQPDSFDTAVLDELVQAGAFCTRMSPL